MSVKLEWKGAQVKGELIDALTRRLDAAGRAGADEARARVPVDTGKLRDSIGYLVKQSELTVVLYADMPYGGYVEHGTSRMAARPFIRPGWQVMGDVLTGRGPSSR